MKMDGKLGSPKAGSWKVRKSESPEVGGQWIEVADVIDVIYRFIPKYTLLIGCERF